MGIEHAPDITSFVCDASDPRQARRFEGVGADYLLIMFTLSAVPPEQQHEMLANAFRALRPGGLLMLRDHGLYDMVQVRCLRFRKNTKAPCNDVTTTEITYQ